MKKKILNYLKVIAGLALILVLVFQLDFKQFVASLQTGNYSYAILGFFMFAASRIFIDAYRLHVLIVDKALKFIETIKLLFVSIFINNLMIGGIGGDVYKVYYIKRRNKSWGASASIVFVEKASLLIMSFMIGVIYLLFNYSRFVNLLATNQQSLKIDREKIMLISITLSVLTVLLAAIFLMRKSGLKAKINQFKQNFIKNLKEAPLKIYIITFVTALLSNLVKAVAYFYFIKCFHGSIHFFDLFILVSFLSLVVYIPISIGSLGLKEGYLVFGMVIFGVASTSAVAVAFLARVMQYIFAIFGGIFFTLEKKKSRSLQEHGKKETQKDSIKISTQKVG